MTLSRQARAALIVLLLLAAAGGMLSLMRPAEAPNPAQGQARETDGASAPASAASLALAAQPAASAASSAASAPAPRASAPSGPVIGSEGYGPHIERAMDGHDPRAAWSAIGWLKGCRTNTVRQQSFQAARDSGSQPAVMTQLLVEAQAESRRCQTVTAQHQAMMSELALRALHGGVPGAAAVFAGEPGFKQADAALQAEVRAAIRRDAALGDRDTLINAALSNQWGLSDEERLADLLAYAVLAPGGAPLVESLAKMGQINLAPPNSEQFEAAKLAAKKIVDAARRADGAGP